MLKGLGLAVANLPLLSASTVISRAVESRELVLEKSSRCAVEGREGLMAVTASHFCYTEVMVHVARDSVERL